MPQRSSAAIRQRLCILAPLRGYVKNTVRSLSTAPPARQGLCVLAERHEEGVPCYDGGAESSVGTRSARME